MKKQQKSIIKKQKRIYFAQNKMFGVLTLTVIVMLIIAFLAINRYSSDSLNLWIAIIFGVISGLLASVTSAWLIDIITCRRKNKIIRKEMEDDLLALKMWIDELFQGLRDSISSQDDDQGMTFEVLFHQFVERNNGNKKINAMDASFVTIYVHINLILSTIDKLTTGEEKQCLLLEFGDVYSFLILSKSISDFRESVFNKCNLNNEYVYVGINDFLSTAIQYADLLNKEYRPNK